MRTRLIGWLAPAAVLMVPAAASAAPAAPGQPVATLSNTFHVTLTWADNSAAENGFVIDRCTGPACTTFAEVGHVGRDVTTFYDGFEVYTGAMSYRVRAYDSTAWSAPSPAVAVSWMTTAEILPDLVATQRDGGLFDIDGTAFASSTPTGDLLAYEWSFGDGQVRRTATPTDTVRYVRDGTFAVSMRPIRAVGPGPVQSVNVTATGTPAPAPVVTAATSPARGLNRIDWTSFPSTATRVEVQRCKGSLCGNFAVIATVPLSANRYDDRNVNRGQIYTYRLRAVPSTLAASTTAPFTILTAR